MYIIYSIAFMEIYLHVYTKNVRIWLIENEMDYEELAEKINFNVDSFNSNFIRQNVDAGVSCKKNK